MVRLYNKYPDFRDRVLIIYIILSFFICLFYSISFLLEKLYEPAILQVVSMSSMFISFVLLHYNRINISRFLSISTSYIIIVIQVLIYFPASAGFHFQYLALLVVAFSVFMSNNRKQLIILLGFTVLLCATFIFLETHSHVISKMVLPPDVIRFYFYCCIIGTFAGLYIVLLFFSLELSRTKKELQVLATTDSLTGLNNRRSFISYGNEFFRRACDTRRTFCILMIDVDHFKTINDTYGHLAGDIALKELGKFLIKSFRKTDYPARYGGEEFSVILPDTSCDEGIEISNKIRKHIENTRFTIQEEQQIKLTISIGIACFEQNFDCFDSLLSKADAALYKAKEKGRNCIFIYNN